MDREPLESMLAEGMSLAAIGRVGRHESTVGYWVQQYGLEAVNAARNRSRGPLEKSTLDALVNQGLSSAQIAEKLGRSKTTVRHWLKEYGMQTRWGERRRASAGGEPSLELSCPRHGLTTFGRRRSGGYRCNRCRAEAVSRRRRKVKRLLVSEAGGACVICGYDRYAGALEFHHLDRAEKSFALSHRGVARSLAKARVEASKCILVCSNCHAELEGGVITLSERHRARVQ